MLCFFKMVCFLMQAADLIFPPPKRVSKHLETLFRNHISNINELLSLSLYVNTERIDLFTDWTTTIRKVSICPHFIFLVHDLANLQCHRPKNQHVNELSTSRGVDETVLLCQPKSNGYQSRIYVVSFLSFLVLPQRLHTKEEAQFKYVDASRRWYSKAWKKQT